MAKSVKNELAPDEMYKLKYENKEFYKLRSKLWKHKHFLGGYIFMDNQLANQIEDEVGRYGLVPNKEKITDFIYANHESISNLVEHKIGDYLPELLMFIVEEFVQEHIEDLTKILGKESEDLDEL